MSFKYVEIHVLGGLSFEEFVNSCIGAFWGGPKLAKEDFVCVWVVVPFDKVWVVVENMLGNLFLVLFLDIYF